MTGGAGGEEKGKGGDEVGGQCAVEIELCLPSTGICIDVRLGCG